MIFNPTCNSLIDQFVYKNRWNMFILSKIKENMQTLVETILYIYIIVFWLSPLTQCSDNALQDPEQYITPILNVELF